MSERYEGQTYYEILELTPQAGPTEIYNAYQRARSTYSSKSPALYSMFTPEEAKELLLLIEEAYQTLSHQMRRQEYDVKIGVASPAAKPAAASYSAPQAQPSHTASIAANAAQWVGPVKVTHAKKEDLPKGMGRTKFGSYQVNPEFEKQIETIEECDGVFLQKVRKYKSVSLEQLSEEIRVIKTTLTALEGNDLKALPVAVFTRGFVVQIARALGMNEKRISDAYMKFFRANKR
jgi:hypothetical protein